MKNSFQLTEYLAAVALTFFVTGCARSHLGVHVDLFPNKMAGARIQEGGPNVNQLLAATEKAQEQFNKFMAAYISSQEKALEIVRKAPTREIRRSSRSSETEEEVLTKRGQESAIGTLSRNIERAQQFKNELGNRLEQLKSTLWEIESRALVAATDKDLQKRFEIEAENRRNIANAALEAKLIASEIKNEVSEGGDDRPRKLSIVPIRKDPQVQLALEALKKDNIIEFAKAEKTIQETEAHSETHRTNSSQAGVQLDHAGSGSLISFANPDLLADDGDPFYQQIIGATAKPAVSWSTNFFEQNVSADGKANYLIVRETPVRFTVHEAKSNPSQLIDSQLRLARAGLQTVASLASTINPALSKPKGTSASAESKNEQNNPVGEILQQTAAARAQQQQINLMVRKLIVRVQALKADVTAKQNITGQTKDALNKWATNYFSTDVAPVLRGYSSQLGAVLPSKGQSPEKEPAKESK